MGTDLTGECPVCSTPLESHELEKVQQHYKSRKTQISLEIKEMSTKGKKMVADKEKSDLILNEERDRLTREIKRTEDLSSRLRGEKERLEIAKVKSKEARLELVDLIRERDKQVILEQKELNELESDIKLLDYDIDGHETLIIESDELSHYEKEFQELNNLEKSLEYKIDRHHEMSDKIKSLNSNLLAEKENITILDKKLENLIPFQGELKTSDRKYRELNDELIDNQRVIDTLEYQLKELNKLEKEIGLLRAKKDKLFLEKIVYEDLAVAFGVKGVQALLVETAVPQLEKDTNELLGKITDNRMSVRLATQRQTKAGERTETLDILIGDEWGTRPYEMYSGGENFRIDFAIRIALSKLLARRSGMRIPLLFIDEGFGSQDQNGKNTLSAAINSLRIYPEFKDGLILVITHLEDVKNQFDNRIEIEKTSNGSEFSVIS
jgi:exonuclease SbcC